MQYLQFSISDINDDKKDILIALLSNIGFEGFDETNNNLEAFIKEDFYVNDSFESIVEVISFKYSKSIIKEQNWNEKWESNFEPILVSHPISSKPFVYIRASFHKPNTSFEYDIEVTPKMSFGTGHHATTYMMVANMRDIIFKDKSVIDFGTGTGILAILAEKMGASKVLAIDNDEWSINNAKENVDVNNCRTITIVQAETIADGNNADIILANINLNIIKENIDAIKKAAKEGTIFLFSGIMLHDENDIVSTLTAAHIHIKNVFKRDNWLCILANR